VRSEIGYHSACNRLVMLSRVRNYKPGSFPTLEHLRHLHPRWPTSPATLPSPPHEVLQFSSIVSVLAITSFVVSAASMSTYDRSVAQRKVEDSHIYNITTPGADRVDPVWNTCIMSQDVADVEFFGYGMGLCVCILVSCHRLCFCKESLHA
jgi:hypothetical protein